MSGQSDPFKKIDDALALYYLRFNVPNYRNADGDGRFLQFIKEEKFNDPELPIDDELGPESDPNDCAYSCMCRKTGTFPIPHSIQIPHENEDAFIFYILQYCYQHSAPPSDQYIQQQIVPKCNGTINNALLPHKLPEPTKNHLWDELIHILKCNDAPISYFRPFINHCIRQKSTVYNYDDCELKRFITATTLSPAEKGRLFQEFHICAQSVANKIRWNEILAPRNIDKCNEKYYFVQKLVINLKTIRGLDKNDIYNNDDEQLTKLLLAFDDFNDILCLNDMISRIVCQAINYGEYNTINDKCFETIFNGFVRCNFRHYVFNDKKLKLDSTKYFEAMSVIRKRLLTTAPFLERIQKMDKQQKDIDDDEYKVDEKDDDGFDYNLRAVQLYIYFNVVTFLKYALKRDMHGNYCAVYEITDFVMNQQLQQTFASFMEENEDLFNIFDKNKNDKMIYCAVNALKKVSVSYIERTANDIDFKHNTWFDLMRAIGSLRNKVGVSIHFYKYRLRNAIKIYWHCDGSVLPLTLKDLCCSKWWKLRFKAGTNGLDENNWNEDIHPYLSRFFIENALDIDNHDIINWNDLDKPLYLCYADLVYRLSDHKNVFKNMYKDFKDDTKQNENDKCKNIWPFTSRYGGDVELEVLDTSGGTALFNDFGGRFDDESELNNYVKTIFSSQKHENEIIAFSRNGKEKAIFPLGFRLRGLYGIIEPDPNDSLLWKLAEYRTAQEISTCYYGLCTLPNSTLHINNYDGKKQQSQKMEEAKDNDSDGWLWPYVQCVESDDNVSDFSGSLESGTPMAVQSDWYDYKHDG